MLRESRSLRYPSLDAAVAELQEVMTMVEAGLKEMEQAGAHLREPELYGQMRQSVETLRDPEVLRQRLAKGARPDGTVEFRFDPQAWEQLERLVLSIATPIATRVT